MEEGLLIGIAIVAILIILGIIFGVFDWIAKSFSSLFDQFGIFYLPI
jgi:Tfp pilus assembly protein FimT